VLYVFGPKDGPDVVAYVFQWSMCTEVVILRGEDDASAYRVPTFPETDVFTPPLVSWQYHAFAAWTLRAVLTIDPPGHPNAPTAVLRPRPVASFRWTYDGSRVWVDDTPCWKSAGVPAGMRLS
jgi:hypothetical protein